MTVRPDLLTEGLEQIGLSPESEQLRKLHLFLSEIELWNSDARRRKPGLSLVRAEGDDLIVRHVLDSLAGLPLIRRYSHATIADIGSGAGFPGIPLSVFLPETQITLVERSGRKAAFLRNAAAVLKLGNVTIEEVPFQQVRGKFDVVTFRALKRLDSIVKQARKIIGPEGIVAAYKGKASEIEAEIAGLGECAVEVYPLDVPFLREERHLVVIPVSPDS